MPRGKKRVIVPTAKQKRTLAQVSSFLAERGFTMFPLAASFQRFEGYLAIQKDSVMSLEPHPHALVSELPDPLIKQGTLDTKLRRELRRRFHRRVEFGGQVRLCQKTLWHEYLSPEDFKAWLQGAGVTMDKSRAA
jgi:hypothetical protein